MTLRTLNYGNYGIFLIMGNAGFCPSAVWVHEALGMGASTKGTRPKRETRNEGSLLSGPPAKKTTGPFFQGPLQEKTESYGPRILPLVSREWKNGSNSSYNCTPFLHSLLTKGKELQPIFLLDTLS